MRSYPYWPAKIKYPPGGKRKHYTVVFFYTLQLGYIDTKFIEPFNDETIVKFKPLCHNKNYFRESLEDALVDEAQEGLVQRSDEIKMLPLYEEPAREAEVVFPAENVAEVAGADIADANVNIAGAQALLWSGCGKNVERIRSKLSPSTKVD